MPIDLAAIAQAQCDTRLSAQCGFTGSATLGTLVGTLLGYSVAQAALAEAQHSHDPNVLGAFVAAHPSHPEGLLQVGACA
jgi:hypothetical protein